MCPVLCVLLYLLCPSCISCPSSCILPQTCLKEMTGGPLFGVWNFGVSWTISLHLELSGIHCEQHRTVHALLPQKTPCSLSCQTLVFMPSASGPPCPLPISWDRHWLVRIGLYQSCDESLCLMLSQILGSQWSLLSYDANKINGFYAITISIVTGVLSGQLLKKIQNELRPGPWHIALLLPSKSCDPLLGITKIIFSGL